MVPEPWNLADQEYIPTSQFMSQIILGAMSGARLQDQWKKLTTLHKSHLKVPEIGEMGNIW